MRELLATARNLAEEAGDYIRQSASRLGKVEYKGRADLVTDVDRKAEEIIVGGIRRAYPDHAVLAEESGENGGRSEFRWVVVQFEHPGGNFETRVVWSGSAPLAVDCVAVWEIAGR